MSRRLARLATIAVTEVRGVGPRRARALAALGVESVLDLLMYYPRRYSDRTEMATIAELVAGEQISVHATVERCAVRHLRGRRSMVEAVLGDGSGATLKVTFFNQPWRAKQLVEGAEVVVNGRPTEFRGQLQMTSPLLDLVAEPAAAGAADGDVGAAAADATAATAAADGDVGATPALGRPRSARQTGRIVPIYPQSDKAGVASYQIAEHVSAALEIAATGDGLDDPLSPERLAQLRLVGRAEAFREIHEPTSYPAKDAARRRLAFDELWRLQVALVMRKRAAMAESRGIAHPAEAPLVDRFIAQLPFPLTRAQERALGEIARDLSGAHPMHRLLQGDVGSGKTVVALATLLFGVAGGYQGALMVPTEVLAEQHHLAARALLDRLTVASPDRLDGSRPVAVELLTSRTPGGERSRAIAGLADGTVDLVVGTHALLTEDVRFAALGVVVVDEQHRFGVDQRAALREKGAAGHDPDLLVMTATPIPRTAAMTVYGDLDASVLDELPPGRTPVATRWVAGAAEEAAAWQHVRDEVAAGHQAYVVCPLVRAGDEPGEEGQEGADEESVEQGPGSDLARDADSDAPSGSEPPDGEAPRVLRSAVEEHARLVAGELAGLRVGLLHGQLRPSEKEPVMAGFRAGALDVLVATTVIEVGVDVAQATVMVIEDADRFGIAQLHQLRGRVGRSDLASACYLFAPASQDTVAAVRLRALETSSDGFALAEVDLELRGEGTVLGARQKGRNDLKLASLRFDAELIEPARQLAEVILDGDPGLERHPIFGEELRLFVGEEEAAYLFKS